MQKPQNTIVVAAAIIRTRLINKKPVSQVCIVKDADDDVWGLPGGKFETGTGETYRSCLLRELHDELRGPEFTILRKLGEKEGLSNTRRRPTGSQRVTARVRSTRRR